MKDMGLGSWTRRRDRMTPGRIALVDGDRSVSYAQVEHQATRLAHDLRGLGVGRGDRVAFLGLNSIDFVLTLFATAKLGAVFLPLNTRLAAPEAAGILRDAQPSLLIWADECAPVAQSPEVTALGLHRIPVGGTGSAPDPALDQPEPLDGQEPLDEPVGPDDLFMIQYTSGSSGRPKGVRLSHGNVTWNAVNLLVDLDLTGSDVALVAAPLFHTAALNQVLLPVFLKGGTSILEPRWDPRRAIELIETHGVTMLFGVPAMYQSLLDQPGWHTADLRSLRTAIGGGAPLPESVLRAFLDRGLMLQQGYGLTETSPGATFLRGEDNLRKVGSVGTACFFSDVRLVGPDLQDVPPGSDGEVLVQGPNVTDGYWRQPEATAAALLDGGWLRTGDLARQDGDGDLTIVGRLKDMIISGGENIYPAEVEQVILTHPAVADCVVIGVPDARWGETGRAVVVPVAGRQLTAQDVLSHLAGKLARYKIPASVLIAEELPRTGSGKLNRGQVRDRYGLPQVPR